MARFIYALNQSLDGHIDHTSFAPDEALFDHFVERTAAQAGCIYGRVMYEVMRLWDTPDPGWSHREQAYADAWCGQDKIVVSRTLTSVGPRARLLADNVEEELRRIKHEQSGDFDVSGSKLAASLARWGLLDEYQLYVHPVVTGGGTPYFSEDPGPLTLADVQTISADVVRLTYAPRHTAGA